MSGASGFKPRFFRATTSRSWIAAVITAACRTSYRPWLGLAALLVLLAVTAVMFNRTPTGFIPDEDQGYFLILGQGPEGVSLDYTHRVQRDLERVLKQQSEIEVVFDVGGFSFTGSASNKLLMFAKLKPWAERRGEAHSLNAILGRINQAFFFYPRAQVFAFNPPSIPGLGFQGGFTFELEDRASAGIPALLGAAYQVIGPANAPTSGLFRVYTTFTNTAPSLTIDVDREKVKSLGINLVNLFATLQVYLGSVYVNDFDLNGQSFRVYVRPIRRIARASRISSRCTSAARSRRPRSR